MERSPCLDERVPIVFDRPTVLSEEERRVEVLAQRDFERTVGSRSKGHRPIRLKRRVTRGETRNDTRANDDCKSAASNPRSSQS